MAGLKADNDPWTPLSQESNGISQPPCDPRYQLIDSDRYIESLERKLQRLKGRNRPEPSSRDIISSLAGFRDDQMRRFLQNGRSSITSSSTATSTTPSPSLSITAADSTVNYLQRRLHPERQALNTEELFELLKDDQLARNRAQDEEEEEEEDQEKAASSADVLAKYKDEGKSEAVEKSEGISQTQNVQVTEEGFQSKDAVSSQTQNDTFQNCDGENLEEGVVKQASAGEEKQVSSSLEKGSSEQEETDLVCR